MGAGTGGGSGFSNDTGFYEGNNPEMGGGAARRQDMPGYHQATGGSWEEFEERFLAPRIRGEIELQRLRSKIIQGLLERDPIARDHARSIVQGMLNDARRRGDWARTNELREVYGDTFKNMTVEEADRLAMELLQDRFREPVPIPDRFGSLGPQKHTIPFGSVQHIQAQVARRHAAELRKNAFHFRDQVLKAARAGVFGSRNEVVRAMTGFPGNASFQRGVINEAWELAREALAKDRAAARAAKMKVAARKAKPKLKKIRAEIRDTGNLKADLKAARAERDQAYKNRNKFPKNSAKWLRWDAIWKGLQRSVQKLSAELEAASE